MPLSDVDKISSAPAAGPDPTQNQQLGTVLASVRVIEVLGSADPAGVGA